MTAKTRKRSRRLKLLRPRVRRARPREPGAPNADALQAAAFLRVSDWAIREIFRPTLKEKKEKKKGGTSKGSTAPERPNPLAGAVVRYGRSVRYPWTLIEMIGSFPYERVREAVKARGLEAVETAWREGKLAELLPPPEPEPVKTAEERTAEVAAALGKLDRAKRRRPTRKRGRS
jgi:hypothetical protein